MASAKTSAAWFTVDKAGLSKLVKDRPMAVLELVQNAWDQKVTRVDVWVKPEDRSHSVYRVEVVDDDPDGFADLSHAYTVFAESTKKADPTKRGRFNFGEKRFLSLCSRAEVRSTKGAVIFDGAGRHDDPKRATAAGSVVEALIRLEEAEFTDLMGRFGRLIPPAGIDTYVNGSLLQPRSLALNAAGEPMAPIGATLDTELGDAAGNLKKSPRKTSLTLYALAEGEAASLYEMGIPVVEIGGPWHVDVGQKVPLNMDRDNVTPGWLGHLRAAVLNGTSDLLTPEAANESWAREAVVHPDTDPSVAREVMVMRVGERALAYDPTDREANDIAVSEGYRIVHSSQLSKAEWALARSANLLPLAGKVTPSPTALLNRGGEEDMPEITEPKPECVRVGEYAKRVAEALGIRGLDVKFVSSGQVSAAAWFGGRTLTFNVYRLGLRWFQSSEPTVSQDALLLHEFAHDRVSGHLTAEFADEIARLGATFRRAGALRF